VITAHRNSRTLVSLKPSLAILLTLAAASVATGELSAQLPAIAATPPSQPVQSLSMVSGDFDEDGFADLVIGSALKNGGSISLMRGNPDALAPRTHASWLAVGRHQLTTPFLQPEETIRLTAAPDMLTAADVNGDGHLDLAYASKNSAVLQVMLGTGKGSFSPNSLSIAVPGKITALTAYRPGAPFLGEALVVGYKSRLGFYLSIVSLGRSGLKIASTYALPGAATAFSVANLDDDFVPDTAIVAGGQLLVLHGRNAINGGGRLEVLPVDGIEAVTSGEFLFDRHGLMQLAALTTDGDVLILAHQGIDSRPFTPREIAGTRNHHPGAPTLAQLAGNIANQPWTLAETDAQAGAHSIGSETPVLLRSRSGGSDDLEVLNPSQQQRVTIKHPSATSKAPASLAARIVAASLRSSGDLAGAVAVRTSADGRSGLAMLSKDSPTPEFMVPSPGNTFYVNTTADNTGSTTDPDDGTRCSSGAAETCTLRDAVTFANADADSNIVFGESDTIMVPAGVYPLTWQAGTVDVNGNAVTHLEVLGAVTIVGDTSGVGVTIDAMNNDVAFSINPGPYGSFNPGGSSFAFDTTLENIAIENGTNPDNLSVNALANANGGGINWDAAGTGNLTLVNVKIQSCLVQFGPGGGLWVENSTGSGSGTVTLTGGSITSNLTAEEGGGIYDAYPYATIAATNTVISGNSANPSVSSSDPGGFGAGGGVYFVGRTSTSASPGSSLTGVQITSNYAAQQGAGVYTNSGILLSNSVIGNNASGALGGGVYAQDGSEETGATISGTSIVDNQAISEGGGVYVGNDNPSTDIPSVTMNLSRIFGNTSGGTTGLALNGVGAASATYNWWGCNAGPANASCNAADGAAVTNPWAVMGFSANSTTVIAGQSMSLTVSMNTDSNGLSIQGAFPGVTGDSIGYAVTGVTASPALTSGTFNSAGTDAVTLTPTTTGSGTVSAAFDNQTLSVNFTVEAPPSATITSPKSGSTLAGASVTFTWTVAIGATNYKLFVGSTGKGSYNLYYSGYTTATSAVVGGLPTNGSTIYVRLFTNFNGTLDYNDYTYTAVPRAQATLTSPAPGSTLPGTGVAFTWTAATGATDYELFVGSTGPGSYNLYYSGNTLATSATVNGLPANGETIYARLYTKFGAVLEYNDYIFAAVAQAPAVLTSPVPGTALPGTGVTFTWTPATGATDYEFFVGSTGPGSYNLYYSGNTLATSATVGGLPANGETIYARLFTKFGGVTEYSDYVYTAVPQAPAVLSSPTPGTTLPSSSVTFTWNAVTGATDYELFIGNTGPGSYNLFYSGNTTATSLLAGGLPTNGGTLNVRLYTKFGGTLEYSDYIFTAVSQPPAMLTAPTNGSTLPGSSVTFTWNAATGATDYELFVGSTGPGSYNLYYSGDKTVTSLTVSGLPTNGETIYARLYTNFNGTLEYFDYTFTAD
jgi:hypothetical protein